MEKEIGQFTLNEMFQTCKEYNDENVKFGLCLNCPLFIFCGSQLMTIPQRWDERFLKDKVEIAENQPNEIFN